MLSRKILETETNNYKIIPLLWDQSLQEIGIRSEWIFLIKSSMRNCSYKTLKK